MPIIFDNITFTGGILLSGASGTPGPTPLSDQYFQYTTLLLDGLGTNGAQNNTFLDSSSNNFTITRNGNTTQGSFTPFSHSNGYWSNYFDGSGDYLSFPGLTIGTNQYTVEFWFYHTGTFSSAFCVFGASASNGLNININNSTTIAVDQQNVSQSTFTVPAMAPNTWNHVAVVRNSSNVTTVFLNGVRSTTGTVTMTNNYSGLSDYISRVNNVYYTGYLMDVRVAVGSAFYDPTQTTITVPTAPLTAISGTSLLTCQSNNFKDNSTNNFAITSNGDTRVTLFQPFTLSSEYNSSTMGGSMYFDGSGDYLTLSSGNAFAFGTGNFTVEMYVYINNSIGTVLYFMDNRNSSQTTNWALWRRNTNQLEWFTGSESIPASTTIMGSQWHHVAYSRSGTTGRLFLNGVQVAEATDSQNYSIMSTISYIGTRYNGIEQLNGYISNLRIVKGTAVYTTNFTPPTAPVTAISGTSLLLSGTNAGIVDSTGFNDLETISGAKISTAQSKWGGSSMLFNGSTDYATTTNTFLFGTGKFTIEAWIYPTTTPPTTVGAIFSNVTTGIGNTEVQLALNTSRNLALLTWNNYIIQSSTVVSLNQWTHVAATFDGITFRIFINGVVSGTSTATFNFTNRGRGTIGWSGASGVSLYGGYIQGLRVTEGIARYTTTFTPPTDY